MSRWPSGLATAAADCQRHPAAEDRKPLEHALLLRLEEVDAPGDGVVQRARPLGSISCATGRHGQPERELREHRLGGEHPHPGSGQLDGQRQPVQPPTQLGNRRGGLVVEGEIGRDGLGPGDEQLHGRDLGELLR